MLDAAFLCKRRILAYLRIPEHYRYAAFRHILTSHLEMDDAEIAHYIHLAEDDADQGMAQSALMELLLWSGLTNAQFDMLALHPAYQKPEHQKQVRRRRLLDDLNNTPVIKKTFEACLASGDTFVQRELVAVRQLTQEQLQILSERGSSRAVRNMARVRVHR